MLGSESSPPVNLYTVSNVYEQLRQNARDYINEHTHIFPPHSPGEVRAILHISLFPFSLSSLLFFSPSPHSLSLSLSPTLPLPLSSFLFSLLSLSLSLTISSLSPLHLFLSFIVPLHLTVLFHTSVYNFLITLLLKDVSSISSSLFFPTAFFLLSFLKRSLPIPLLLLCIFPIFLIFWFFSILLPYLFFIFSFSFLLISAFHLQRGTIILPPLLDMYHSLWSTPPTLLRVVLKFASHKHLRALSGDLREQDGEVEMVEDEGWHLSLSIPNSLISLSLSLSVCVCVCVCVCVFMCVQNFSLFFFAHM